MIKYNFFYFPENTITANKLTFSFVLYQKYITYSCNYIL